MSPPAEDTEGRRNWEYQELFQRVPAMLAVVENRNGQPVIIDCNDAFCRTLGYDRAEVVGRSVGEFYSPAYQKVVLEGYARSRAGDHFEAERELVAKDGRIVPCLLRTSKEHAIFIDITTRKENEQALAASSAILNSTIEHLRSGVCHLDEQHNLVLSSQLGKDLLDLLAVTDERGAVVSLGGIDIRQILDSVEVKEVTVTGPPRRVFEIAARPVENGFHDRRWVVSILEVTREKEIRERAEQQERLASIGQLAAGIAHDFNNMLTVIMGTAQLMQMQTQPAESYKEDLGSIFAQGEQAGKLIRQILDFSRQGVSQHRSINLVSLVKESVKLLNRTLEENVTIDVQAASEDLWAKGDPTQVQQILTNLAVNARDAMPDGGSIQFTLDRWTLDSQASPPVPDMESGAYVVWSVRDTGIGMDPDILEHVFEPFFTTKREHGGTGLGLAQVYGIVKQFGGHVLAESEVGVGTTFTIFLPEADAADAEERAPSTGIASGLGDTVLLAEDKPEVRKVVTGMLKALGYQVIAAEDGGAALEHYRRDPGAISLVLTDMMMPRVGGRELVREIRKEDPALPIIVMSGYSTEGKESFAVPEGINGYLQKPLVIGTLAESLKHALEGKTF